MSNDAKVTRSSVAAEAVLFSYAAGFVLPLRLFPTMACVYGAVFCIGVPLVTWESE